VSSDCSQSRTVCSAANFHGGSCGRLHGLGSDTPLVVELLLAYKADVNAEDGHDRAPLYEAVDMSYKDVAELLRQHGGHE